MNISPHYLDYFIFLLLSYTIRQPDKPISTKTKSASRLADKNSKLNPPHVWRIKTKKCGIPYFFAFNF
jgi:hypothetical protein